jgi:hypothetical protein
MHPYSVLEARRAASQDATRPSDRLAVVSALLGAVLVGGLLLLRVGLSVPPPPSLTELMGDPNAPAPHAIVGAQPIQDR